MALICPLGSGWKAVFDAAQGKFYYTQGTITQWEWPTDLG
jgi:hypothetical protein